MKRKIEFSFLAMVFLTLPVNAAVQCEGTIHSQAGDPVQKVTLTPMAADKTMLMGKKGRFSFVADIYEIDNDRVRLFIHDLEQDHTSVTPATLVPEGAQKTASIKQIIGYESAGQSLNVELICNKD